MDISEKIDCSILMVRGVLSEAATIDVVVGYVAKMKSAPQYISILLNTLLMKIISEYE